MKKKREGVREPDEITARLAPETERIPEQALARAAKQHRTLDSYISTLVGQPFCASEAAPLLLRS
jgi:hypothetical protein